MRARSRVRQLGRERGKLTLRRLGTDRRFETPGHSQPDRRSTIERFGIRQQQTSQPQRHVRVGLNRCVDALKFERRDADEREPMAVDEQLASDRARVGAKVRTPEPFGDHDDGSRLGAIFLGEKEPSESRTDREDGKEVAGDEISVHRGAHLTGARRPDRERRFAPRDEPVESMCSVTQVFIERIRRGDAVLRADLLSLQSNEATRIQGARQRTQHHCVHRAEDRGHRAASERDAEDRDPGEERAFAKHSSGEIEIDAQAVEHALPPFRDDWIANRLEVLDRRGADKTAHGTQPERDQGGPPILRPRRADLIAKQLGHVRGEPRSEFARKQPEQASVQSLRARGGGWVRHVAHSRMIVRTAGDFTSD
jgi:hypothetical protein